jgi:hypothetical protein
VGNSEGKRLLGRTRRRWVDNIKIDLGGTEQNIMEWTDQLRIGTSGGLL